MALRPRRKLGWGNHTVLKTLVDLEVVSLGREIGNIDVRCNLVKAKSKWRTPSGPITTQPNYPLDGVLYFEFQFREDKKSCLMSAKIDIALRDADGGETIPVTATYPGSEAVKPDRVRMKEVSKTRRFNISPKANTPFVGGQVGGFAQQSASKSQVEETYSFTSFKPSRTVNKAEFFWKRNYPTDWTGTDRGYDGALTFHRKQHKDIILDVLVTISDQNNSHFGFQKTGFQKTARERISREYGITPCEESVFNAWADNLKDEVRRRNRRRRGSRPQTSVPASSGGAEPGSTGTSSSESCSES